MSRPYRVDKPIDSIPVPLNTVRGLYVLLGQLMEKHADTHVCIGSLEEGVSGINAISLWETTEEDCRDYPLMFVFHTGPYPDNMCQNPDLFKELKI